MLTAERGRARQGRDLAQRFTELRYSFDQRRARQRPLPRLTPQERGRLDRTGLSKVTGEQFRLVLGNLGECAFEGFGDTGVEQWLWRMI